tara:strand:+ start:13923 stop:14084 length:162 start_codon:yes stop_codon:yes gene_type:complete
VGWQDLKFLTLLNLKNFKTANPPVQIRPSPPFEAASADEHNIRKLGLCNLEIN